MKKKEQSEERSLDIRNSLRVVTSNEFITACGLEKISLKARKLLYVAISQCRKTDKGFYLYQMTVKQFADMMGIAPTNIYNASDDITDELMKGFIKIKSINEKKWYKFQLFNKCDYDDSVIMFELNQNMNPLLIELKSNFTQPLLEDFLHMNSPYSMSIWHLMQREMKSKKAYGNKVIEFDLSLEEIRKVTGTEDTFKRISDLKRYVIDKAIREIRDNCNEIVAYENIKRGRKVVGFHFKVKSPNYMDEIDPIEQARIETNAERLRRKSKGR